MLSASMEAEAVKAKAKNFEAAMARLATNAAMVARVPPSVPATLG
jgi:hypothetical protein